MDMDVTDFINDGRITMEFPHLERLYLRKIGAETVDRAKMQSLFQLNPQIQSLTVHDLNTNLLRLISEHVPSLPNLEQDWVDVVLYI